MSQNPTNLSWGRAWTVSPFTLISTLLIITMTPLMVFYFYISCAHFQGALSGPLFAWYDGSLTLLDFWGLVPSLTQEAVFLYLGWVSFQAVCAVFLPDLVHKVLSGYVGGMRKGAVTPAGNQLPYNINGLQAWIISHLFFLVGAFTLGWFSPSIIFDHWGPLLIMTNLAGNVIALFAFLKAYLFPSHPQDRKFTGSALYNFYMGIELNPRIGAFDFKLFFNGRPGIIGWTLINLSFAAAQYQMYGTITNSMILVNLLQAVYVLDFFWNEAWYLNTIDIAHDHFGWMLAWGDNVWLPYMYTLQGLYLVYNPVVLPSAYVIGVFFLGVAGYMIFRSANNQKERFRRTNGQAPIWGQQAEFIPASYTAADGTKRETKLLVSGWWGMARHLNYTGDLMGSLAYCMACGWSNLLPYFYIIYMLILLIHRCIRDEHRCSHKYGEDWKTYCKQVPYRLIPKIF